MQDLIMQLSELIKERNYIDQKISSIINRPAMIGHMGEFIASKIFGIELEKSASNKSIDGKFNEGTLSGCTVNIKWFSKNDGLLNLTRNNPPDYYLVMTGPKTQPSSSLGKSAPLCIEYIFLFKSSDLITSLKQSSVKNGTATRVDNQLWDQAEIYPNQENKLLILGDTQKKLIKLFSM